MKRSTNEFKQVPIVVLCGGSGVVLDEHQGQRLNKGLIQLQNKPLFWWVMLHYAIYGATDFLLATGYQSESFDAALNAAGAKADPGKPGCYEVTIAKTICQVRIVATAQEATTAERLLACKPWLEQFERFALTYSDTLSDADLGAEMRFHKSQKLVATLIAIKYPVRFRVLGMRQGEVIVRALASRPVIEAAAINGGYYIFTSALWGGAYGIDKVTTLETLPLELMASDGQLAAFEHNGRWQNCDAERDLDELRKLTQYLDAMVVPIE